MRFKGFAIFCVLSFATIAQAMSSFPQNPDPRLTPGALCEHPDAHRYPERIAYCNRDVDRSTKKQVINEYNTELGYRIESRDRQQFKIDHLIPLCVGGSNDETNLWPQHESVYVQTDPLEGLACDKMAKGRLNQSVAVELILRAKHHLEQVPQVQATLEAL